MSAARFFIGQAAGRTRITCTSCRPAETRSGTLAFRDHLRDHSAVAREYEILKRQLAERFSGDDDASREGYADAKSEFIERVVRTALDAGYPHSASPHDHA